MDGLNVVTVLGTVKRTPIRRELPASGTIASFVLQVDETTPRQVVTTEVPCECWGWLAEQGGALCPGDVIAVQGKLAWRAGVNALGGTLVVTVQRLTKVMASETVETAP